MYVFIHTCFLCKIFHKAFSYKIQQHIRYKTFLNSRFCFKWQCGHYGAHTNATNHCDGGSKWPWDLQWRHAGQAKCRVLCLDTTTKLMGRSNRGDKKHLLSHLHLHSQHHGTNSFSEVAGHVGGVQDMFFIFHRASCLLLTDFCNRPFCILKYNFLIPLVEHTKLD